MMSRRMNQIMSPITEPVFAISVPLLPLIRADAGPINVRGRGGVLYALPLILIVAGPINVRAGSVPAKG
jgi:hypothetical protein